MADDLDTAAAVRDYLQGDVAQRARASLSTAQATSPDVEADLRRISAITGVPMSSARANPDAARRRAAAAADYDEMATRFPSTMQFLAEPENARIAHDDLSVLSGLETVMRETAWAAKQAAAGLPALGQGTYGVLQAGAEMAAPLLDPLAGTILPANPLRALASQFGQARRELAGATKDIAGPLPVDAGVIRRGISSGFQSVGGQLPALLLSVATGNPVFALSSAGITTGGRSFGEARDKGIPTLGAVIYGGSDAAIEVGTEMIPMARLLGDLKAGSSLFKTMLRQAAVEVPGEQVATALQDLNEWAVLNPDKPFADYLRARPGAAAETLVATLVGVGVQTGTARGAAAVAGTLGKRDADAQDADALAKVMQTASTSKLRDRDPTAFAALVQATAEDAKAPAEVYIDARAVQDALQQSGVTPEQFAAALPSAGAQLAEAVAIGGDIVIPIGEFAAGVSGSALEQSLLQHVRTSADALSQAEAKSMGDAQSVMSAAAERMAGEVEQQQADTTSRDAVRAVVLEELNKAGRFTEDVNRAYADMTAAFFATTAARVGISAEELYKRYPLRVQAGQVGGPVLEQEVAAPGGLPTPSAALQALDPRELRAWQDAIGQRLGLEIGGAGLMRAVGNLDEVQVEILSAPGEPLRAEVKAMVFGQGGRPMDSRVAEGEPAIRAAVDEFASKIQAGLDRMVQRVAAERYGISSASPRVLKQGARATFSPSTNTITLLARADLTSFLHESGHFYLEVLADLASQPNAPAEIVEDMGKVLQWFGLNEDSDGPNALERWRMMTLDEQRPYHEKFARGFEAYLFEGKAPSAGLSRIFDRFKSWMLAVYRSIKALNVEIDRDVRGVFDRLLASQDEIARAEAARSLSPLFASAKDGGMTDAEWEAYQKLGAAATGDAVDDLQARSLRDMKWLSGARAKKLRELQQEAAKLRREVRIEARAEVMQRPVYRAWRFLSGRAAPEDTANAAPKDKPSKTADPARDSLLVAVAKLGGINRDSAMRDLGVPEDSIKVPSGVFGSPVFRKTGGRGADDMLQALTELGYMHRLDEFGRATLAEFEEAVAREIGGDPVYSVAYDYGRGDRPADPIPETALAGKLDTAVLRERYGIKEDAPWRRLSALRMTSEANGLDPDLVAETFGFDSGDAMIRAILEGPPPGVAVDALVDQRMLERYGELSDPQAIERAVDAALHNDTRARFVATELSALDRAVGKPRALMAAARQFAADLIGRKLVKDVRVGQFTAAETRAAGQAGSTKDLAERADAKRAQLLNHYAAREAGQALDEIDKGVDYLRKFEREGVRSSIDPDYIDQIDALLERFDLRRSTTGKDIAKRQSLAKWLAAQEEMGLEPDIPADLLETVDRRSYKELSVSEFRGLVDTVRQIEHLGRLKNKLLTAKDQREFAAVRDTILQSIDANRQGRTADTRSANTRAGQWWEKVKSFGAAHIKVATWARVMDGGKDGGPLWEYLIRTANEAGDRETVARAKATRELSALLAPLLKTGSMSGDRRYFDTLKRSLNREARIAIALNWGNEGNRQRLLGGEGWQAAQVEPVLRSLTAAEWQFVQSVWDHFEQYRPEIGAKERRVYGREPEWVEPAPFDIEAADGGVVRVRGGYYPIRYDPRASERAESHSQAEEAKQMMRAAYTAATTRRSFTKARAEKVEGRPLLYALDGIYTGTNEVIHDLSWHEWLIDANRLVKDKAIAAAMRGAYGPEVHGQFKTWLQDVALGDKPARDAGEAALAWMRQGVSVAGIGLNIMNAALQPLGITQSISRIGATWVARGLVKTIGSPLTTSREISELSPFMATRFQTQFRELNELRNQVKGQTRARRAVDAAAYSVMLWAQRTVDIPTWWGAYEKALAEGSDDARAASLADQAVIDAQGSGMTKDLAAIERGSPALKLFTVFYSFFNTTLNNAVARTMTEPQKWKLAVDYLLLFTVPAILGVLLKDALTPGDAGDDDPEKLAQKLIAAQASYMMNLMFGVRELGFLVNVAAGEPFGTDYTGPAGLRLIVDTGKLAVQVQQGEADDGLRKAIVNFTGVLLRLPAAQINRTITGTQALIEGETDNPAAVLTGYQEPR